MLRYGPASRRSSGKRAKTTAERQRAFRQRQADRAAALVAANAELRAELADIRGQLAGALAQAGQLTTQRCRHPAAAVDAGHCHACNSDIW